MTDVLNTDVADDDVDLPDTDVEDDAVEDDDVDLTDEMESVVEDEDEGGVEGTLLDADGNAVVAAEGETPKRRGRPKKAADSKAVEKKKKDDGLVDGVKPVTAAKAKAITEKLRGSLSKSIETWLEAYNARVWVNLGYATWVDYLNGELGDLRLRLPAPERLRVLPEMAKMPTRAAAAVLGVDQSTIVADRKKLRGEDEDGEETVVVGEDGKEHAASDARKARPAKVKPVGDRFSDLIEKLDTVVGDLVALTGDEGFEEAAGEIATKHRADLKRYSDQLDWVRTDRLA